MKAYGLPRKKKERDRAKHELEGEENES